MNYRKADIKDISLLVDIRKKQLIDDGIEPNIDIDEELTKYFNSKLADNSLVEWIAEEDNKIIATGMLDRLVNEAKERNIHKIWLGASKLGRPVYKKYGFQDTDE